MYVKKPTEDEYIVNGHDLNDIRNIIERRVCKAMQEILPVTLNYDGCKICTQDIYALSLKHLRPIYVQVGSIILQKTLKDEEIYEVVKESAEQVYKSPNHT
ncbi:MAG: late competence development ComFB family protein [Nitrospinae bacterium]|nr:late competence development ComFB family protein [Nitrospinota bacterium]